MNSFLFNAILILLSSVSVTQFCSTAFAEYTSFTDINLLFSVQIKYLRFFQWFYAYNVFVYSLLGIIVISTIYLGCRPSDVNSVQAQV